MNTRQPALFAANGPARFSLNVRWLTWAAILVGFAISLPAAADIEGTAKLSGNVTAEAPFTAGQVYARNHDTRMTGFGAFR